MRGYGVYSLNISWNSPNSARFANTVKILQLPTTVADPVKIIYQDFFAMLV